MRFRLNSRACRHSCPFCEDDRCNTTGPADILSVMDLFRTHSDTLGRLICLVMCVCVWRGPVPSWHSHDAIADATSLKAHVSTFHSDNAVSIDEVASHCHWVVLGHRQSLPVEQDSAPLDDANLAWPTVDDFCASSGLSPSDSLVAWGGVCEASSAICATLAIASDTRGLATGCPPLRLSVRVTTQVSRC